jgi:plasmid maintenance system killer protein
VPAVLIWWIITERKRGEILLQVVLTDWQRQREEEIEKRAEEKFQRKLTMIPAPQSPPQ